MTTKYRSFFSLAFSFALGLRWSLPKYGRFLSAGRKKAIPKTIADNAMDKIKIVWAMSLNLVRVISGIDLWFSSSVKFRRCQRKSALCYKAKNAPEFIKQ
jgi:hypothetical protein